DDIASNLPFGPWYDDAAAIHAGKHHALDLLAPVDAHRHITREPRHTRADQRREIAQTFAHQLATAPQRGELPACNLQRIERCECRDAPPGAQDLRRDYYGEGTRSTDHDATAGEHRLRLEQRLSTAGIHHARGRPAGERHGDFAYAGGEDDRVGSQRLCSRSARDM